jgi:hypothetical protein
MRFGKPSPSMAVAGVALFVSLGGTSIAAVNYARNAGAVDGRSAVSYMTSTENAAGKLVATQRGGVDKGKLPARFVDDVPATQTFGRAIEVTDNAQNAPEVVGSAPEIGSITASCVDENAAIGVENPASAIALSNSSGEAINVARQVGNGNSLVTAQLNGTVAALTIQGSNTFSYHLERRGVNLLVHGVVRQDGRNTSWAACLVYGTVLRVES